MNNRPAHFGIDFTKTTHEDPYAAIDPSKVTLPDGFTVLITGASKGIGAHIAYAYAKAKASRMIITARGPDDLKAVKAKLEDIASSNGRSIHVTAVPCVASSQQTFIDLKKLLETEYGGRLDCLANNAGTIGSNKGFNNKIHETDPTEHAKIFDLNYTGPMYSIIHLIPLLLNPESVGKNILNISSIHDFQ